MEQSKETEQKSRYTSIVYIVKSFYKMIASIVVLLLFYLVFQIPISISNFAKTHENAKIIYTDEDSIAYYLQSNSVYLKFYKDIPRSHPRYHIELKMWGLFAKEYSDKQFMLELIYYQPISIKMKKRILNDANISDYDMTLQWRKTGTCDEKGIYREAGNLKLKVPELYFHSKNNSDIILKPNKEIIDTNINFHLVSSDSYLMVHAYYNISDKQLFRLFNEKITSIECPLNIDGIDDHLNLRIKRKMMRKLYERYLLIDNELNEIKFLNENKYDTKK